MPFDAVFVIGPAKTGTTSTRVFLQRNGLRHLTINQFVTKRWMDGDYTYLDRIPPEAVAGAQLTIDGRTVHTIRSSRDSFELPAGRTVMLELVAPRYRPARDSASVEPRGHFTWQVNLERYLGPEDGKGWAVELGGGNRLDFAYIHPGTFRMGSPPDEHGHQDDETAFNATLTQGFWLARFEVTQAQYQAVMGENPSEFKNAGGNAPVESVDWEQANAFCQRLTARERAAFRLPPGYAYQLPTEAQFEYAARAGTTTATYAGVPEVRGENNDPALGRIAWYTGNCKVDYEGGFDRRDWWETELNFFYAGTLPVGKKQPNDWGLYDMIGNVSEWCADWYDYYPQGSAADPYGAYETPVRVVRGGSWSSTPANCRAAAREYTLPEYRENDIGFRVALAPLR